MGDMGKRVEIQVSARCLYVGEEAGSKRLEHEPVWITLYQG